jgi:hypothetical protein
MAAAIGDPAGESCSLFDSGSRGGCTGQERLNAVIRGAHSNGQTVLDRVG